MWRWRCNEQIVGRGVWGKPHVSMGDRGEGDGMGDGSGSNSGQVGRGMGYEGRLGEAVSWIVRASGWVDIRDMEAKWASWSVSHAAMTDSDSWAAEEQAKVRTGGQGLGGGRKRCGGHGAMGMGEAISRMVATTDEGGYQGREKEE